jgi:hypothetical protein
MTTAKKLFATLLTTAALAPGLAMADYAAVAFGTGSGNWAFEKTQAEANWEALKKCNEHNPKKDCHVQVTKAVVKVGNSKSGYVGYSPSEESVDDAKAQSLKACAGSDCKVDMVMATPGFWSLAASKNKDGVRQHWLTQGYADMEKARADAIAGCEARTEYQCAVVWAGAVAGNVKP